MALFAKRQDYIPPVASPTAGSSVRVELTREFAIEAIYIRTNFTLSAGTASTLPGTAGDGIAGIIKKVNLTVSDGSRTRNVVDSSGSGLIEYGRQLTGSMDKATSSSFLASAAPAAPAIVLAGTYQVTTPIYFAHPQIDDPVGSITLLPAPRFSSNPILNITFASALDMSCVASGGTGLSLAINWYDVVIVRRQVNIPNWSYYDTELIETSTPTYSTGNNQLYELPTPGSYTGILLRGYNSTLSSAVAVKSNITLPTATFSTGLSTGYSYANVNTSTVEAGEVKLQMLGTVLRRFKPSHVELENDYTTGLVQNTIAQNTYSQIPSNIAGYNYYMDFLTDKNGSTTGDLGSVLDSNVLLATGNRIQLLTDVNIGAASWKVLSHRIYGDLSPFKLGLKKPSK